MIRIFISIALLFAAVFAFDRLGGVPVTVAVSWPGGAAAPPLRVIVVGLLVIAALAILLWKLVSGLMRAPGGIRGYFVGRRRDRGFRALSRGMIAVGSGDYRLAQGEASEAARLLPGEPLVMLLGAQAAQLEGRSDAARAAFTRMLADPATRLLGLRGLYIEASRAGEAEAARQYAAEAHRLSPGIPWAGTAMMERLGAERDWAGALKVLEDGAAGRLRDRDESRRLRAVLLTARALEAEDGEPEKARGLAFDALKLLPDFVPAAAAAARLAARLGDLKRAAKAIETAWKTNPHPELALAYLHLRSGDSAFDRLKRARFLEGLKPHHVEGALAVARAALDAREFALARQELAKALRQAPTERVCLMMAELEETETGEPGRVREWLGRAVRAPRDAAWTADGVVLEHWQPTSPVSGRLGAVDWRVPVTSDAAVTELDGGDLAERAAVAYVPPAAPQAPEPAPDPAPSAGPELPAEVPPAVETVADVGAPPPPDDPGLANGHGLRRSLTPDSPFR